MPTEVVDALMSLNSGYEPNEESLFPSSEVLTIDIDHLSEIQETQDISQENSIDDEEEAPSITAAKPLELYNELVIFIK